MPRTDNDTVNTIPVTLCIPVRNRAHVLPRVLEAVGNLHPQPQEIVVFDNGSTDGSAEILSAWIAGKGKRARVIFGKPESWEDNIPRARNACLAEWNGETDVFFLDSDVVLPEDALEVVLSEKARMKKPGMICLPYGYSQAELHEQLRPAEVNMSLGATLLTREFLVDIGGRFDEAYYREDDLWTLQMNIKFGYSWMVVDRRVLHLHSVYSGRGLTRKLWVLPRFHWLLLKDGLWSGRLYRTYGFYYALWLSVVVGAACDWRIGAACATFWVALLILHYKSMTRAFWGFVSGTAMSIGLPVAAVMDLFRLAKLRRA